MNLTEELAEAEARVSHLRNRLEGATCEAAGHDWKLMGGKNAGCGPDCGCSVPVHECTRCGDCDYGENRAADEAVGACARRREAIGDGERP